MTSSSVVNSSNKVYLTTNELGQQSTLGSLKRTDSQGNTICGVSGFSVLNMASLERGGVPITHVALFDLSDRVEAFWQQVVPMIQSSPDAQVFQERLGKHLQESWQEYFLAPEMADRYMKYLQLEISHGVSWLSNRARFDKIQQIFNNNCFSFTRLDVTDPRAFGSYLRNLEEQGLQLDTIYVSNINCCIDKSHFHPYHESLEQIPPQVNIIDASIRNKDDKETQQRMFSRNPTIREAIPMLYRLLHSANTHDIELGLRDGLDPDERDIHGFTPLMTAAEKDNAEGVSRLLEARANIDAKRNGRSLLHYAGGASSVRALIQANADLHARDNEGLTPLHLGAAMGNSDAVRELLLQGGDPTVIDSFGFTPLELGLSVLGQTGRDVNKRAVQTMLDDPESPTLNNVLVEASRKHASERFNTIAEGARLLAKTPS